MESEVQETEVPPSKKPKLDSISTETDFTQDVIDDCNEFTVNKDSYTDIVPADELDKLREFKVLDETKSNDEDSHDGDSDSSDGRPIDDDEIDKMLEENLPEGFKKAPKPKERAFYTVSRTVLEEKGVNHFEVLPLDWMMIQHYSGMPLYMHRTTRVCTLSKPYFLGKGNARRHEIPLSAIPCLAYRRALEEEEKQKEIDRRIEEQVRNQKMENMNQQNENSNKNEHIHEAVNKFQENHDNRLSKSYFGAVCDRTLLGNIRVDEIVCENDDKSKCPYSKEDCKPMKTDSKSEQDNFSNKNIQLFDDKLDVKRNKLSDKYEMSFDENSKTTLCTEGVVDEFKVKCPYRQAMGEEMLLHANSNKENSVATDISDINNVNLDDKNMVSNSGNSKVSTIDVEDVNKLTNDIEMTITDIKTHNIAILDRVQDILNDNNEEVNRVTDDVSHVKLKQDENAIDEDAVVIKTDITEEEIEKMEKNEEIDGQDSNTDPTGDKGDAEIVENTNAGDKTNENKDKESNKSNFDDISLSRRPVTLPGGIVMAPPRVETVSTSLKTQHLTPEQLNDYCKKLFKFKVVKILHFKRWADRRKYNKARKTLQYPALSEGTKLITIPMQHISQANGGRATKRDWVMSMNGGSYLSVFHEYVGRALQKQPVYEFKNLENAATPYQATVYIGGMQYGVGYGSSKRQAKAAAARASVHILIPEMKDELDAHDGRPTAAKEDTDFSFFDNVGIEDPRIMELCAATCEPSPHAILKTCLLRNFGTGERHIHIEMKKLEYQKIELTMKVGKHTATVACKNKKTAKQRASQAILQALHPHVRSWGSLLRLYGSKSVKSCKEKKLEEQQITLLQDKARHNEPNYAVLEKLRSEMLKLKERDAAFVPIGSFLLTDSLPTHSNSDLNNVDL